MLTILSFPSTVVAGAAGAVLASGLIGAPAQASSSHRNTDPYLTGCANSSYTLSTKTVSGGKARIKVSTACGTNWIEYSGRTQTTTKTIKDHRTNKWTRTEVDRAPWSYSMQVYAPGTTPITAKVKIGSKTTTASCSRGCSWKTSGSTTPSTLSKKVDAFVSKWDGKSADFDGIYGAQCVDLVQYYNRDVVGARFMTTPYSGGAKDIWSTYDANRYTRVGAGSTPRKGDVAVWDGSRGGGYGHIAIVLSDRGGSVKTLTQNPGATRVANISKSGLLGYLRPRR